MGTNFYTVREKYYGFNPEIHIGKRSAAGQYCWDCKITLCKLGNEGIHHSGCKTHKYALCDCNWHNKCPKCGKTPKKEKLEESSAGRELGFNKSKPKEKIGVTSVASFNWAMKPEKIKKLKYVYDEYGDKFTLKEFKEMLEKECPIQYFGSIGKQFC